MPVHDQFCLDIFKFCTDISAVLTSVKCYSPYALWTVNYGCSAALFALGYGCYARTLGQYARKMSDVRLLFQALVAWGYKVVGILSQIHVHM